MNKNELLRQISVYANNVEVAIRGSSAEPETKRLAKEIADETCQLLSAMVENL